jgi:CelD/BcsL family acetyltransferase involved in cellulose biosynthesis
MSRRDGAAAPLTARIRAGLDGFAALEHDWRVLFEASASEPAVSFDWTQALIRTEVAPSDACYIVEIRCGDRLVGVVPLIVRVARVFGQQHVVLRPLAELKNTHSDVLAGEPRGDVLRAFLEALRTIDCRWDSIRLSKLLEGHSATPLLESAAVAVGYTPRRRFRKAAYWLPLPRSLDEYLAGRSAKFRNYAKRAEKKLRATGRLQEIEITSPSEFEAGYDALLHVERASWKEPYGTSISALPRQAALFRELGRALAATGRLHLHLLTLDGEPIAHNYGCIHRGTYYYLKTSYAARQRPRSPATFLRLSLIAKMIVRGVSAIDFCGTPYEWQQQWTDTYRWHHVLSIYQDTWRGRMFSLLDPWIHYSSSGKTVEHEDPRSERA